MSAKQDIKLRILEAGAHIIHRKGFNNTGIQEVLEKAGVPKGSFYFYFKNKEDFGLQVIDHFGGFFMSQIEQFLNDTSATALQRLRRFFDTFLNYFETNDFQGGCPIGNLAQEMGDLSEPFREKLKSALDAMKAKIAAFLYQAQEAGELPSSVDVAEICNFMISSWEGALLQMKVFKSTAPLRTFDKIIFEHLLR